MLYLIALLVVLLSVVGVAIDLLTTWSADYGRTLAPEASMACPTPTTTSAVEARPYGALTQRYGHPWPVAARAEVVRAVWAMDAPPIPRRWTIATA